jgi:hypothetical protein
MEKPTRRSHDTMSVSACLYVEVSAASMYESLFQPLLSSISKARMNTQKSSSDPTLPEWGIGIDGSSSSRLQNSSKITLLTTTRLPDTLGVQQPLLTEEETKDAEVVEQEVVHVSKFSSNTSEEEEQKQNVEIVWWVDAWGRVINLGDEYKPGMSEPSLHQVGRISNMSQWVWNVDEEPFSPLHNEEVRPLLSFLTKTAWEIVAKWLEEIE